MTPQERVLLLQKLASPQGMPTAEARQAIETLADMYRTKPTTNIGPILPY